MSRLTPRALDAAVVRIERTAADNGKRALTIAINEPDVRTRGQIARRLGISMTVLLRATRVVNHAPELVPEVLAGRMRLGTAARVAHDRQPTRVKPTEVVRLPTPDVRIDVHWVGAEISKHLGAAIDVVCELPRPEDVAEVLRSHGASTEFNARVARAAIWLTKLADQLKGSA